MLKPQGFFQKYSEGSFKSNLEAYSFKVTYTWQGGRYYNYLLLKQVLKCKRQVRVLEVSISKCRQAGWKYDAQPIFFQPSSLLEITSRTYLFFYITSQTQKYFSEKICLVEMVSKYSIKYYFFLFFLNH